MSGMLVDTHRHAWWQRRILAARVRALVPRREPGASAMQKTCGGPEVAGWQLQKALPQRPMLPNALTGFFFCFLIMLQQGRARFRNWTINSCDFVFAR